MTSLHVKKGDTVAIISGEDKGKKGTIVKVFPKEGKVLLEGMNLKTRHQKPRRAGKKGQVTQFPHPIFASKVKKVGSEKKKTEKKS